MTSHVIRQPRFVTCKISFTKHAHAPRARLRARSELPHEARFVQEKSNAKSKFFDNSVVKRGDLGVPNQDLTIRIINLHPGRPIVRDILAQTLGHKIRYTAWWSVS